MNATCIQYITRVLFPYQTFPLQYSHTGQVPVIELFGFVVLVGSSRACSISSLPMNPSGFVHTIRMVLQVDSLGGQSA